MLTKRNAKRIGAIAGVLCGTAMAGAQAPAPPQVEPTSVRVDAAIASVTLYRGRASVTRKATLTLQPGVYDLKISGLPEAIQAQTLQARTQGGAKVLSVDYSQEQSAAPSKRFAELDAEIENLQRQLKDIEEQRGVIKAQEQFIDMISAKAAGDAGKNAGTAQFDLDAIRKQLTFIAEDRGKLIAARRELDIKQLGLEKQLQVAQATRTAQATESNVNRTAVVSVVATEAASTSVELSYLVTNATWEPVYNVRASLDGSSAQIEYDAMLTQRTGEDWEDVKLTLSTAQPNVNANPPAMAPWYVDLFKPEEERRVSERTAAWAREGAAGADAAFRATMAPATKAELGQIAADAEVVGEGPSVSFELPRAVTVTTNIDRQQRTRIVSISTNPKFVHVAVPMLTDAVYIRGDMINTSAYQLLPGRASVFLAQDYIGPTTLPAVAPNGEIKLYFGIDPAISVVRKLVSKRTENTGLLSGGRRTSYEYRVVIDNGSGKGITVELWDRCPVSRTDQVQIEPVELSHPLANDATYLAEERPQGLLKWLVAVPPTATGKAAVAVTFGVRINRAKDVEMTALPE